MKLFHFRQNILYFVLSHNVEAINSDNRKQIFLENLPHK